MSLRPLAALVLTASACLMLAAGNAAARKAQAGGAQPPAADAKCGATPGRSPALFGFRLGMSASQVVKRFPEFRDLARFQRAEPLAEWKDAAGGRAITGGDGGLGLSVLRVEGRYLKRRLPRGGRVGEFRWLDLRFLDGRLVSIDVSDWVSPGWENVEGFKAWIERRHGLAGLPWHITRQEKPPDITYFDFQTVIHTIDCDGFVVQAYCIGPPGPPNVCYLEFKDPSAPKIVEARRAAAPKQGQKK